MGRTDRKSGARDPTPAVRFAQCNSPSWAHPPASRAGRSHPAPTATSTLAPLRLDVIPNALAPADAAALNELLDEAAEPATDAQTAVVADEPALIVLDAPVATNASDDAAFVEASFDVEVHVLGQVHVTGLDAHLTPGETELLAYLALHRRGDTADTIMTLLWPTQPSAPKTFRNRASNLRNKLGTGSDGQLLFPEARDTGRYQTSPLVTTDLERFRTRLARAERASSGDAIELLKDALALVNGPPFRAASGYDWAYAEQIEDTANHDIQHAACRLALEAEDPNTALWAASQAKQGFEHDTCKTRSRALVAA